MIDLSLYRPRTRLLRRQTEEDLRFAVDEAFPVLKRLAEIEPELGAVSGPDGVPVRDLETAPESWVDWFRRDMMVVGFTTKAGPYRDVSIAVGLPGRSAHKLSVSATPEFMTDAPRLRRLFEAAIPVWDAHEARISHFHGAEETPWLYWFKGGREPEGYVRGYPTPDGWSVQSPLHDGILYEWPENRPVPA